MKKKNIFHSFWKWKNEIEICAVNRKYMRNIFIGKLYAKFEEKLIPDPFLKNENWAYLSLDQQFEILYNIFLRYIQVEDYRNILKLTCWLLAFISYQTFLKNKKRSETNLLVFLSTLLLKNNIFHVIFLLKILGNSCIVITYFPVDEFINFEINLSHQIAFLHDQKSRDKNLNIWRTKRPFKMKEKTFFMIVKGFSLK